MFRTMIAKKSGRCGRNCGVEIQPGDVIRWAPRQGAYHIAQECPASDAYIEDPAERRAIKVPAR